MRNSFTVACCGDWKEVIHGHINSIHCLTFQISKSVGESFWKSGTVHYGLYKSSTEKLTQAPVKASKDKLGVGKKYEEKAMPVIEVRVPMEDSQGVGTKGNSLTTEFRKGEAAHIRSSASTKHI